MQNLARNKKEESENLFFACYSIKESANNVWYMDSSCMNHMTSKLDNYINLDMKTSVNLEKSMNTTVNMGDGICLDRDNMVKTV